MSFEKILASRITTVVLVALLVVFGIHTVNLVAENVRADLTEENLYSLSEGTREILDKMGREGVAPIEIRLYFSETAGKTLPKFIKDFITYERYLEALLEEYAKASEGKVEVRVIDPLPDSDAAQDALDYGLEGKPINQEGDLFFFGLVFETRTGTRDVVEFLWPNQQESVEYEISKRIQNLIWPTGQRIGVMSGLTVLSDATNPYMAQILAAQGKDPGESWTAMQLLDESYQVSKIPVDVDHISPEEFDLVVVVHPKNLGRRALWALDEWVTRGGNTLIFVDPYALEDQPPQNPQQPWAAYQYEPSSDLDDLFERWGVRRVDHAVAADFELAITRPVGRGGPAERVLVDLEISGQNRDRTLADHPVLRGLTDLRFFLAGSLEPVAGDEGDGEDGEVGGDGSGVTLTPLITTTDQGSTLEMVAGFPEGENLVFTDVNNPGKLVDHYQPGGGPVVLAYQLQGELPPLYPDGVDVPGATPPPPPGLPPGVQLPEQESDEVIHKDPVPEEERGEATVMVFADVDFISDPVAFQNSPFGALALNDNHKVLLNAVDYLFGSEELMKVRSKREVRRPFLLFDEIEEQADRQTLEREKELRAEIDRFQEQLDEKQRQVNNQALFKKQLQDEVDELNERIAEAERELREIRQSKRAAIEAEESRVRFATLGTTPLLVLALGLVLFFRRKMRDAEARRSKS